MPDPAKNPAAGKDAAASRDDVSPPRASLFFRLALIPAALLVLTVLAYTSALFGDANAPAQQWLRRWAGWLIAAEVLASLLLGLMALADDRRRIIESRMRPADRREEQGEGKRR